MSSYTDAKRAQYWNNREESLARTAAYYKANSAQIKINMEIRNYGEPRAAIIGRFGAQCGLCKSLDPGGKVRREWHVDHDHSTGFIRGVLCTNCNTGLGKLGDSIEGLKKALAYLEGAAARALLQDPT